MLKRCGLCRNGIKIHVFRAILGVFPYFYTMLYTKMFHGYDILKHLGNMEKALDSSKMLTLDKMRTSSLLYSLNRIFEH